MTFIFKEGTVNEKRLPQYLTAPLNTLSSKRLKWTSHLGTAQLLSACKVNTYLQ